MSTKRQAPDPYAGRVQEILSPELDAMERDIIVAVMKKIRAEGSISPEYAVQQWLRVAAVREVDHRLGRQGKRAALAQARKDEND